MWINYGKSFRFFCNEHLNQPGVQVDVADDRPYLIGDVNAVGGACDDCQDIYSGEIIARYRILLTPEELAKP